MTSRPPHSSRPPRHPAFDYRPPRHLVLLRLGLWGTGLIAAFCVLYVAYWFIAAGRLQETVVAWTEARRAEGMLVAHDGFAVDGFPLWLRATFANPQLGRPDDTVPGGLGPWAWRPAQAVLRLRPWAPQRLEIQSDGPQGLDWGRLRLAGRTESLVVGLEFDGGALAAVDAMVAAVDLTDAATGDRVTLARAALTAMRDEAKTDPFADLQVEADDLTAPPSFVLPLGRTLSRLRLDARVIGRVEAPYDAAALAAWRDTGGTIEVDRLETAYGPLAVQSTGTLALDGAMQPTAAFNAQIRGFFETVERLRTTGWIKDRDAVTAKLVLGVLARNPGDGGGPVLSLPITLQERRVFVGPLDLFGLPPVRWPEAAPPS